MRPINCGFRSLKGCLLFVEVVPSIVNPVNKLYSLAYKVQQTFFVPAIKTWISEQHDTSFLLSKYYSYWKVFYLLKMCSLSLVSIWSLRLLQSLRKKSSAIIRKPLSGDRSDRGDNDRWERIFSISVIVVAVIAGKWFPYDRCDCWTFFCLSDHSDRSDHGNQVLSRNSCIREYDWKKLVDTN